MNGIELPLASLGHLVAATAFLGLAAWLQWRHAGAAAAAATARRLRAAVWVSGLWALAAGVDPLTRLAAPAQAAALLDVARQGLWILLLLALLAPAGKGSLPRRALARLAAALVLAAAAVAAGAALAGHPGTPASRLALASALALPLLGLVLVEQFFRNLPQDARWNAKPMCLGLSVGFVFDLYVHAEALLFGHFDADALAVRGLVHALAVPLLAASARQRTDWMRPLQISRSAAFHSATLLLAGGYLLLMAAAGYYVRFFGGSWGRALQIALLALALALLGALVLSGALRARVRVFVGKHFFSHRFDYRERWLHFTAMLSQPGSPQETSTRVIRGLAEMVDSPGGSLWTRGGEGGALVQAARWNMPASHAREEADSALCRFLQERGWVVDLDEYRQAPRRYGGLALPPWLTDEAAGAWLVVPLLAGAELLGLVVLARPRAPMQADWEVRDLLKTAARQAAGLLAQMHATEALLEARKFEAFNRMSAFVVHDLKNIVSQLTLMLRNARRLQDNPEFRQDMLMTVENSLEKMRRLVMQLREGATPPGGPRGVELAPLAARLAQDALAAGRRLEVQCPRGLATRGHGERLERVLGHLVQNAFDATPAGGRVWLRAARQGAQVGVEIGDTGAGMSEEFVRDRLFRPFATNKAGGMGIGAYESAQYVRELGGGIRVDSAPGRGTVVTLELPLFEAHDAPAARATVEAR